MGEASRLRNVACSGIIITVSRALLTGRKSALTMGIFQLDVNLGNAEIHEEGGDIDQCLLSYLEKDKNGMFI
jgi:hypothetical protein